MNILDIPRATLITDWVNTLRYGRYKKNNRFIKWINSDSESFCTHGVLIDLLVTKYHIGEWQRPVIGSNCYIYNGNSFDELPLQIQRHLGIADWHYTLIALNDGKDFRAMANVIEERMSALCGG